MWKHRRHIGLGVCGLGVIIILALVLPSGFWWFLLGAALIAAGFRICRCK